MTTLSTLQADLIEYRAARSKILKGQEYKIGTTMVKRPDLIAIERTIGELESRINMLQNGGASKVVTAVFRGRRG